jgi:type IV secretion system protein VirB9
MKRLWIALVFALLAPLAAALETPQRSEFDARIRYIDYNPDEVVRINALTGAATTIVFDTAERVTDDVSGFADAWDMMASDNYFYLKPKAAAADTNLFIRTNRRFYAFQLHHEESDSFRPRWHDNLTFVIRFRYPQDVANREAAALERAALDAQKNILPEPRNWKYTMHVGKNSEEIAPAMAYDDGRFTYLKFPNNRDFPTVFMVNAHGKESIINSHIDPIRKDVLVIQRVAKQFVLRLGDSVVGIYNEAFDVDGTPTPTGSTVPNMQRDVK